MGIEIRGNHPESNGAIEDFHRSLRHDAVGEDVQREYAVLDTLALWVEHGDHKHLHAAEPSQPVNPDSLEAKPLCCRLQE